MGRISTSSRYIIDITRPDLFGGVGGFLVLWQVINFLYIKFIQNIY